MGTSASEAMVKAQEAFKQDYPDRLFEKCKIRAEEDDRFVVIVYSPVPNLHPTPYLLYEVRRDSGKVRELGEAESVPYKIQNYK